jgi:hypothetical protein
VVVIGMPHDEPPSTGVAFGLSQPLRFPDESIGVAFGVGLTHHVALQLAAETHQNDRLMGREDTTYGGRINSLVVGAVYYPRHLWDGLMIDANFFARSLETTERDLDVDQTTDSRVMGVRVLAGWSWRLGDVGFLALAAGFSAGRETGEQTRYIAIDDLRQHRDLSRISRELETYLRVGFAYGR